MMAGWGCEVVERRELQPRRGSLKLKQSRQCLLPETTGKKRAGSPSPCPCSKVLLSTSPIVD